MACARPVLASNSYKYRLAYVVNGKRVVGYDNERGRETIGTW